MPSILKPLMHSSILTNCLTFHIDYFVLANASSVILRDGITSDSKMLKQYNWPFEMRDGNQLEKPFQSFVSTLSSGFYIAFKGVFSPESRFAIVYTAFSYIGEK